MSGSLQQPVLIYDRIDQNRRNTFLLFIAFTVLIGGLFAAVGAALGSYAELDMAEVSRLTWVFGVLGVLLALGVSAFAYYSSSSVVLGISEAQAVTKEQAPELYRTVENLCIGAGLPLPRICVIEDSAPNAFATGRDPQHAAVAVTRGLLDKLDRRELEGVIAHELSHIGNYDIRVMTMVVMLAGLAALVSDFMLRWTWYGTGGRSRYRSKGNGGAGAIVLVLAVLVIVLAPLAALLLRMAVSRQREYLADASGALLCRNPDALADALAKIAQDKEPLEVANKATAHLYIANPLNEHKSSLNNLFDTHPPIQRRIELLRAM
ncbi:MAG TPA: M48 family metallopeptidase [Dehalococcoidia bacterium]|nr:M48 family metallopeptidase [Dehalococcoidia bacterium]